MQTEDDDGEAQPPEGPAPRRSRTSEKREKVSNEQALAELVQGLHALTPGQLTAVGVSELVLDALRDAKQIKSYAALERHMRFTRGLLRGEDWQPLLRRIDLVRAGFTVNPEEEQGPAFQWTNDLLIQGDPALRRFLETYPETDRRRIRQLMQNVKRSSEARRAKARRILETAVHNAIQHAVAEAAKKAGFHGAERIAVPVRAAKLPAFYADLEDDEEAPDVGDDDDDE